MKYDVVIVPTLAQVETWRKQNAQKLRSGLFAKRVMTFEAWIGDLWELHGDGRRLIDPVLREALVQGAVKAHEQACGSELIGIAPVVVRCVREAAGIDRFEESVGLAWQGKTAFEIAPRERELLSVVARYQRQVRERGLVEFGEAVAPLARTSSTVFARPLRVLVEGVGPFSRIQEQFVLRCHQLEVTHNSSEGVRGVGNAPDGIDVRFAFPSGRLAQPGLMADVVSSLGAAGTYVITSSDPLNLFARLESLLSSRGFCVRVQATKPLFRTDVGRALFDCYRVLEEDAWDPSLLADASRGFFGGFSEQEFLKIDGLLRGNRVVRKEEMLDMLCAESETFSHIVALARGVDVSAHVASLAQRVQSVSGCDQAWRMEQMAALGKLNSVMEAVQFAGEGVNVFVDMLERTSVAVSVQSGAGADVLVTTQGAASLLPESSYDTVLLGDLTSEDYPIAEKDDAVSTLFAKLGLPPDESALERARREFCSLLRLAARRIVLFRPLGDANADETYPAVILEEFIDSYRDDPSNASELDNAYRLPPALQAGLIERGEELLFANARAVEPDATQSCEVAISRPRIDYLSDEARPAVAPRRFNSRGDVLEGLCPSPSQIELYLECPYQWFASRRLRLDTVDEGFGPLERGSFAHEAFETFYKRFQERGHAKVTGETLREARSLMRDVTRELAESQYEREPGSGRLVAASEIERREVKALCNQLVDYLDFEVQLLPTFRPAYFEYEFDADHAVEYAGNRLVGKVDRIDVDDAGHAVIVDYKGSVNAEHEIGGKSEAHCGKVQTRIYAQVVKRALGLDVVASLYVSYGRNPSVTGAYDPRVIEAAHLPGVRVDQCSCGLLDAPPLSPDEGWSLESLSFNAMLDETEEIVSRAEAGMIRGDIAPNPASPKACTYCPVQACPKRGA